MKHFRTLLAAAAALLILLTVTFASAEKTITLSFTGDCTIGSEELTRKKDDSFDAYANKKGYDYFFANFRNVFEQDDVTVINFEGVLSDSNAQETSKKRYRFRGPTDFVKILTGSSIDACSLSNNHIADYGKQGDESTKATLTEAGIGWFQALEFYTYEKDGVKIVFVALDNITYNRSSEKIRQMISEMKASGEANAVVVCWHTGHEYRGNHEEGTEKNARKVIEAGADLIIINHPHVLQGIGVIKNRSVFYSLGNFVFGGNSKIETRKFLADQTVTSLYTVVLKVKMTFSNDGKYLGQQITILPALTTGADPVNNYQPRRATMEEAKDIHFALQRDTIFELPEVTMDEEGLSKIEMGYLAAFDGVELPEGEPDTPQGQPEAAQATPTRDTKGK